MDFLREEKRLWRNGFKIVACLDEAGRGCLAGPVVAVAVAMNRKLKTKNQKEKAKLKKLLKEIKDSKKLLPKKRERIYKLLINHPQIEWGIGKVSERVIEKINILEATKLAMEKAVIDLERKIRKKINFLIIDGNFKINSKISQKPIIKADEKVFSCIAASIIAKVKRDQMMMRYHKKYPQYGFDKHKGYPTKYHKKMIKKYGACKLHRRTFKGVK